MDTSPKPRILVLVDWFYPGYKAGGPIQSCVNFSLAFRQEFDIRILTTDTDFKADTPYSGIRPDVWLPFAEGVEVCYLSKRGSLSAATIIRHMRESKADFFYLNSMYSPYFTIIPLLEKWRNPDIGRIVLAPRGMLHKGAIQYKSLKKSVFLALVRATGVAGNIRFQATDCQESEDIGRWLGPKLDTHIVPNVPYQHPAAPVPLRKTAGECRFVFMSRVSPKKNLDLLLRLLAGVEGRVVLHIYGPREDAAYWKACEEAMAALPAHISATYEGNFPHEEMVNRLQGYHFFAMPTHGENFGHAIFESLQVGRPVIISDQTPWRSLQPARAGWDLPLAHPEAITAALQQCVDMDQETYDHYVAGARQYSDAYMGHSDTFTRYQALFT